jgi:hypothetical protein
MHLTGLYMHVLHALPHNVTGRCMQLLHGLCCFVFVSDIPLPPATLGYSIVPGYVLQLLFIEKLQNW